MASLATGSVNFPNIIYENSASFVESLAAQMKEHGVSPEIEVFDLSHIYGARKLADLGLIKDRPHVQFVMGIKNALPAEARILDFLHSELKRVLPNATWTAAGIGRHQSEVMDWVLARGGSAVRTGLEDNIRVTKGQLARSNAELVQMAAEACARQGGRPATSAEARMMLGLASSGFAAPISLKIAEAPSLDVPWFLQQRADQSDEKVASGTDYGFRRSELSNRSPRQPV